MKIGEPAIVMREAQPYVAVRRAVKIPFSKDIDKAMGTLFSSVEAQKIQTVGPVIFKYNIVKMPELEIEFGILTDGVAVASGELVAGELPAGRYAQLTYLGSYNHLIKANAALIDWARSNGHAFDVREQADGDHFASRVEFYLNGPDDEPDPNKLETIVAIKLKD